MSDIEIELERHDRFQLQITSVYHTKSSKSHLEYYLFVPPSLGCTPDRYPASSFYRDLRSFFRYRVNLLTLDKLASSSIFKELEQKLQQRQNLRFGLKLRRLGCELKQALNSWINFHQKHPGKKLSLVELESVLDQLRSLPIPKEGRARRVFRQVDEYISHSLEYQLCKLLQFQDNNAIACNQDAKNLLKKEQQWRKENGYQLIKPNGRNEQLLTRIRLLRRFCESPLFLESSRSREGRWMEQMVFSLAAGVAMALAMAIAFMAQQEYGNLTLQFFNAMVVGYILKDRLKEITRNLTWKRLNKNYFDYKNIISDERKKKQICQIREQVRFPDSEKIDSEIIDTRNRFKPTIDETGESVLLYRKQVQLKTTKFSGGFNAIQDVQFLNLQHMINLTSEPVDELLTLDGDQICTVDARKSYQLWLVTRTTNGDQKIKLWRITLSRKGIRQVKSVPLQD